MYCLEIHSPSKNTENFFLKHKTHERYHMYSVNRQHVLQEKLEKC